MRGPKQTPIELSERQRTILEQIVRRHSSSQQQVKRVTLILTMASGKNNQQTAQESGVHRETVISWRHRWLDAVARLTAAEIAGVTDKELQVMIEEVLMDEPRSGTPVTFSAEQVTQIIAIACSAPLASGRTISHWSSREIAEEAIKRGIVEIISTRSVERFLKRSRLKTPSLSLLAEY
jgi:putative transposase